MIHCLLFSLLLPSTDYSFIYYNASSHQDMSVMIFVLRIGSSNLRKSIFANLIEIRVAGMDGIDAIIQEM